MFRFLPFVVMLLGGAAQSAELPAGEWTVTSIGGLPVGPGQGVTIVVESDRVSGRSGCNRYFGSVTQSQGAVFGALGSTRMACDPASMDIEARFFEAMARVDGFDLDKETLTLVAGTDIVITARR